jgi:phosphoketolase
VKTPTLAPELLERIDAYWRAANYLSVGQIYLYGNPLRNRVVPTCLALGRSRRKCASRTGGRGIR